MTTTLFDSPAAGWYPDPTSNAHVRWWDGRAWTDRQAERAALSADAAPPMPAPNRSEQLRPRRDGLAKHGWVSDPNPGIRTAEPAWLGFSTSLDGVQKFGRATAWSTAGSWFLGFLPWIGVAVVLGDAQLQTVWPFDRAWLDLVAAALYVLIVLLAVISDRAQLVAWGHDRPASGLWILLGPLVYLIVRTVSVYRNVRRGAGPLVVFLVNCGLVWVVDYGIWMLLS